ncbi:hypothetical protein L5470_09095 [Synechococcus sp. PCC 6717]|nr:hypothetical protein [Synechococcus sp. PCC 6717]
MNQHQPVQLLSLTTLIFALTIAVALGWIILQIGITAFPAIEKFGLGFLTSTTWDPVRNIYGVLPQIYGTIVSALIALLVAVPLGLGIAVFLSDDDGKLQCICRRRCLGSGDVTYCDAHG